VKQIDTGRLERVRAVRRRHAAALLRRPGVIGVGIGQAESSVHGPAVQPVIVLTLSDDASEMGLPAELEGIPVRLIRTGRLDSWEG
jgi:hypothetical protein